MAFLRYAPGEAPTSRLKAAANAVVTGGTGGIGRAVAVELARRGPRRGPRCRRLRIPERALRPDRRAKLWAAAEKLVRPWLRTVTT